MEIEDQPIWSDAPPGEPDPLPPHEVTPREDGGTNATSVAVPGFQVYRPASPNGHAILLCQGGGYQQVGRVSLMPEWFAQKGFFVFDLLYRLPAQGWAAGPDTPLQDAQQAMRQVRRRAAEFGITGKIGVMGFSSGGHVAASLATRFYEDVGQDRRTAGASARPDFALLMCPVITMLGDTAHEGSRQQLFGDARVEAQLARRSPERRVTPETCPTFLVHAADDDVVPVANSLNMIRALKAADVPAEIHVYETGGHRMSNGFRPDTPLTGYPDFILAWLARRGVGG